MIYYIIIGLYKLPEKSYNSEAKASKLLENLEDIIYRYCMSTVTAITRLEGVNSLITYFLIYS